MKLLVTGSRDIEDYASVSEAIDEVIKEVPANVLLSGGGRGVQQSVKRYAKERGIDFVEFEPQHELDAKVKFNPANFFIRNVAMVRNADAVLVIYTGNDSNTEHVIELAKKLKKPIVIDIPVDSDYDYKDTA